MNNCWRFKTILTRSSPTFSSGIYPRISLATSLIIHHSSHKAQKRYSTWLLSLILSTYTTYNLYNQAQCKDNQVLRLARTRLDDGINNLRKEYGSDASFPAIRLDLKSGNRYDIEFMIDQRECDLFSVFGAALYTLQEQKKNSGFHILWMKAIQEEDVVAIILEFEENIEDHINRNYILLI